MRALRARLRIALRCEVNSRPVKGSDGRRPHLASTSECLSIVDWSTILPEGNTVGNI